MKKEVIENWIQEAYGIAKAHGFHDIVRKDCHWLMLITTEIAEAVEADRKGLVADYDAFLFCSKHRKTVYAACGQDSPLGRQYHHEVLFERYIKNTLEDELADICIRCCDYLGCKNLTFSQLPGRFPCYPNMFYNTFTETSWEWVRVLNNEQFSVPARVAGLLFDVLYFCDENNIDIEKHVEWKMKYNQSRPPKHGKAY